MTAADKGIGSGSAGGLIVCLGEMLIDFVPTVAGVSLSEAPAFLKAPGGAPANVAIAASRLGGRSSFVGKLGDDEFGRMLVGVLSENGVSVDGVRFDSAARTALAFLTLRADGEREFMFYRHPSADMLLTVADLDLELIRRASIFHFGSISLINEPCRSAHLAAMKEARQAGALLSYDPNLRLALWPSPEGAKSQMMSIWDQIDIVKISDVELEFLTSNSSIEDDAVMTLWRPTMKLLVLTLGKDGCKYYTKNFRGMVESKKVNAIDTTGAGDSFVGAMLWGIVKDLSSLQVFALREWTLVWRSRRQDRIKSSLRSFLDEEKMRQVLKFANACGAITTTKRGAIPSMPSEAEVRDFLNQA